MFHRLLQRSVPLTLAVSSARASCAAGDRSFTTTSSGRVRESFPTGQHMDEAFDLYRAPAKKTAPLTRHEVDALRTNVSKPRRQVHRDGDWHRSVAVWCVEMGTGLVVLQRRSAHKDTHPGLLDVSCAGHITSGDDSQETAVRELHEELGIVADSADLEYLFSVPVCKTGTTAKHGDFVCNEFHDVYLLLRPENTLLRDTEDYGRGEVAGVEGISLADLEVRLRGGHADHVPIPAHYLDLLFHAVRRKLRAAAP